MRFTASLLGWSLDLSLEPTATEAAADEAPTNQGDTGTTFLSFTSAHAMPDEAAIHRPTSPWEDDSELGGSHDPDR